MCECVRARGKAGQELGLQIETVQYANVTENRAWDSFTKSTHIAQNYEKRPS